MSDLISRQEVLNTLDFADNALTDEERTVENYKELLTECIKVLPSAENDGDLISRQAVENITWEEPSYSDPLNVLTEVREKVRALPSVENKEELTNEKAIAFLQDNGWLVEHDRIMTSGMENKGEWIPQPSNKEQGERDFVWWKCSKCGQVIYSETEKDREEFHAFCGRCGADMRGEE